MFARAARGPMSRASERIAKTAVGAVFAAHVNHSGEGENMVRQHRKWYWKSTAPAVLAVLGSATLWPSFASAPVSDPVLRVEEDWELVVNEPNNDTTAPQFHTVMSPLPDLSSFYEQTLWNYRETPDFVPGGVQLHSYKGETMLRKRSIEYGTLSTTAETITWTQSLETDGATLTFSITDGTSTTWGSFGRDMNISTSAGLAQLNEYSPDVSASNSCITFGSNRVQSLAIKRVRYYGASGLLYTDNTERLVCEE